MSARQLAEFGRYHHEKMLNENLKANLATRYMIHLTTELYDYNMTEQTLQISNSKMFQTNPSTSNYRQESPG